MIQIKILERAAGENPLLGAFDIESFGGVCRLVELIKKAAAENKTLLVQGIHEDETFSIQGTEEKIVFGEE